ncbi:hypothetical protein [Candidatus Albibeggiatoa sp. nov. BB20]|uniref:hypothetical protein n=1 Tax=Candidatus Albibeggiatoa sp. nov. BB20 TaxID=3162723 RepID=UPI00336538B1
MFQNKPICEVCGKSKAISFSYFVTNADSGGNWKFTCECTKDDEDYYILLKDFFSSPASTIDWLAHINEKGWMNWNDFMNMMERFRHATDSYHMM